jgi:uncharacterized membrane protein
MLIAMIAVAAFTALVAVAIVGHRDGVFAGNQPVRVSRRVSPIDEAERIIARRYATGEVTAEEYARMLAILRR